MKSIELRKTKSNHLLRKFGLNYHLNIFLNIYLNNQ